MSEYEDDVNTERAGQEDEERNKLLVNEEIVETPIEDHIAKNDETNSYGIRFDFI
jgi:hypothetical protein